MLLLHWVCSFFRLRKKAPSPYSVELSACIFFPREMPNRPLSVTVDALIHFLGVLLFPFINVLAFLSFFLEELIDYFWFLIADISHLYENILPRFLSIQVCKYILMHVTVYQNILLMKLMNFLWSKQHEQNIPKTFLFTLWLRPQFSNLPSARRVQKRTLKLQTFSVWFILNISLFEIFTFMSIDFPQILWKFSTFINSFHAIFIHKFVL